MSTNEHIRNKFDALIETGRNTLSSFGWDGTYYHVRSPDIEYRKFRTETLNITRRVCGEDSDHYKELARLAESEDKSANSYYFKDCLGILEAAREDFIGGYLFDLRSLVAAEILGDFLDQSEALVESGYTSAAASLAGAVLEDTLRKLCMAHGILIAAKTNIEKLNTDLARKGIYNSFVQKRITHLADLRNKADHGHFDDVKKDDVNDMIKWTKRFAADYLK